jgi:lipopolysaccharide export system protein LptC
VGEAWSNAPAAAKGTNLTAASQSASVHAWSASGPRDLGRMLRRARRHSAYVRLLRKGIPAGAVGAVIALTLVAWLKPLAAISELPVSMDSLVVQGTKITMEAPKLNGFTRDNRPYRVTAEAAAQDLTNPTILELSAIKGRMEMQSKATVDMTAVAGLYDTKSELLTLSQYIHIVSSDGYEGFLTEATIEVRQNQMTSEKPVEILMPSGKLNANRMEITESGALVRFDGGIKLALKPNKAPPPPKPAAPASGKKKGAAAPPPPPPAPANTLQGFSINRELPVLITATTLEVRDKEKRATFIGNVIVVQGETTMKSATLDVFYDKDADPNAPPAPVASAAGGPGDAQIRRLEAKGGVAMSQKDQTATSETMLFDMKANTVTLLGGVTVTQGLQVIRGDRLLANMTTGESVIEGGARGVQALFSPNQTGKPGEPKGGDRNGRGAKPPAPEPGAGPPNALQGFSVNRGQPVQISSAVLEVRDKDKRATFVNNVIVAQGDTTMKSKILDVFYDQDNDGSAPTAAMGPNGSTQVRRLEAKGGVVVMQKDQTATGEMGLFDMKTNTVTLVGGVVMTQGSQVVRGERLTVDLTNGTSLVEGGGRGVQTIILPNQLKRGAKTGDAKPEDTGDARAEEARPNEARAADARPEPARKGASGPAARSAPREPLRLN